jgi:hypothetical protein
MCDIDTWEAEGGSVLTDAQSSGIMETTPSAGKAGGRMGQTGVPATEPRMQEVPTME